MAKYEKYAEYQDSCVEWLGMIPSSWQVKKLKYLCQVTTGNKDTVNAVEDGKYPFFVRSQTIERINSIGADCEAVLTAGDGVGVGKVYHYYKGKFDFHQRVYMLYDFGAVTGRFVYYYLSSNFYKVALEGNAKSTVDSLRLPQFLNFEFSLPTIEEQNHIVDFLDHETSKIDSLIAKQKKLIELLKEKRQAVISHAVTKGLNPDVTMKDSGIEWLGDIPSHWAMSKLRYLFDFSKGLSITKENLQDEGIPCVNYGEVHSKYGFEVDPKKHRLKCVSENYLKTSENALLNNGDFVFADTSEDLKGSGNFTHLVGNEQIFAGYHTVIARPHDAFASRFYAYLFDSKEFRSQIQLAVKGVKVFSITQAMLRSADAWLPSLDEQVKIANFLDHETAQIDTLISKQEKQIELMQERRTALISSAVTGKIDVRNWQNPNHNNNEANTELGT